MVDEKERITDQTREMIDWEVMRKVMVKAPQRQQKFISKWVTNQLPVGSVQYIRKFQLTPACPRCGYEYKDNRHIVECPHNEARQLWNTPTRKLDHWL